MIPARVVRAVLLGTAAKAADPEVWEHVSDVIACSLAPDGPGTFDWDVLETVANALADHVGDLDVPYPN